MNTGDVVAFEPERLDDEAWHVESTSDQRPRSDSLTKKMRSDNDDDVENDKT